MTCSDVNNDWSEWKNAFLEAVDDFVPMKRVKGRKSLPWVTNTILYLIKKKNTLRKRIKKSIIQSEHLISKFKDLRSRIKRMLRENKPRQADSLRKYEIKQIPKIDILYS